MRAKGKKKIQIFFNFFFIIPVDMWIFFGLNLRTALYLLVQFDENYRGRNNRIDFFYTLLLIVIPAYSASTSHFHPKKIRLRVIYWMLLTCPMFFQSMVGAFFISIHEISISLSSNCQHSRDFTGRFQTYGFNGVFKLN